MSGILDMLTGTANAGGPIATVLVASARSTGVSPQNITTSGIIPAGSLIYIIGFYTKVGTHITGVTDPNSNSYTSFGATTTIPGIWGAYTHTTSAIASGSTITVSTSGGTISTGGFFLIGYVTNLASNLLDVNASGHTTGTNSGSISPSFTTPTLAAAAEIVFSGACTSTNGVTAYSDSGWTSLFNNLSVAGGAIGLVHLGYKIVSATTAVTYNPSMTMSGTNNWIITAFSFR